MTWNLQLQGLCSLECPCRDAGLPFLTAQSVLGSLTPAMMLGETLYSLLHVSDLLKSVLQNWIQLFPGSAAASRNP
jgi:hypothetical protein